MLIDMDKNTEIEKVEGDSLDKIEAFYPWWHDEVVLVVGVKNVIKGLDVENQPSGINPAEENAERRGVARKNQGEPHDRETNNARDEQIVAKTLHMIPFLVLLENKSAIRL